MAKNKPLHYISIVVPVFNEEENICKLIDEISDAMSLGDCKYELIIVDDGSNDRTINVVSDYIESNKDKEIVSKLTIVELRRNFGQTAAMAAGFDHATGDVIIPMDGDLQNDPADIPRLIEKLDQGYDVVSGWRRDRKDKMVSRKIPSRIANYLIGVITGVKLHDYGCSLKAYRREIVDHINLYGEMHRFIPAIARWSGAKVTEMVVNHRPRIHGKTKYGIGRILKVVLDLVTVKFLGTFSTKPLHVFGGIGVISFLGAIFTTLVMCYQKFCTDSELSMNRNPLLVLTALLVMMSVQFLMMGLLAEMLCRTYHESQKKPTYVIRKIIKKGDSQLGVDNG